MNETNGLTYVQTKERAITSFFSQVYLWMFLALLITAVAAVYTAQSEQLLMLISGNSLVFYAIIIAEFALVIYISARIEKMSLTMARVALMGYALLNGVTLASIFFVYKIELIGIAFITAAVIYGMMGIIGYTTKQNLSPMASFLFIALLGGFVIMLLNSFIFHSDGLSMLISIGLILVFAGLTAYDHQKLKNYAQTYTGTEEGMSKMAIYGALQLYLDFINIFLLLLRLFDRS